VIPVVGTLERPVGIDCSISRLNLGPRVHNCKVFQTVVRYSDIVSAKAGKGKKQNNQGRRLLREHGLNLSFAASSPAVLIKAGWSWAASRRLIQRANDLDCRRTPRRRGNLVNVPPTQFGNEVPRSHRSEWSLIMRSRTARTAASSRSRNERCRE
jgi:hypothetical protein